MYGMLQKKVSLMSIHTPVCLPCVCSMYVLSLTPVRKLQAWRCLSQDCLAFYWVCWACLCRWSCGSVQLALRVFGIVPVLQCDEHCILLIVELDTMVFSNYVKQRVCYYRLLKKNYEWNDRCLIEEGHKANKVGVYFRWYKESGTMGRNPGSTDFFLCRFQR